MNGQSELITIASADAPQMIAFYRDVLHITPQTVGKFTMFESRGVRFAICDRRAVIGVTDSRIPLMPHPGRNFELAFLMDSPAEVDRFYTDVVARGAQPIAPPANMPWYQRNAFFADPEGNIHEIFASL